DACRVLCRTVSGAEELVAYVVWSQRPEPEALAASLRRALPASLPPPLLLVSIDRLPLTPAGAVDDQALARLEAVDEDLARRWESRLQALPGVERVKVVTRERAELPPPLHLSGLLPGWRPGLPADQHTTGTTASAEAVAGESRARPPAYAHGGDLTLPPGAPRTLGEALVRVAAAWPERGITVIGDAEQPLDLSYPELLARARSILGGLRARGLRPRDRVILQLELLADHLASFWACVLGGIIPLTVARPVTYERQSSVLSKLWNVWELLARPAILTSRRLVPLLAGVPALYRERSAGNGGAGGDGGPGGNGVPGGSDAAAGAGTRFAFELLDVDELALSPPAAEAWEAAPDDVVFHQLTSGSTGIPKCIQETHRGIIHHIEGSRLFNGFTSDDVDLNWLPFDHVVPTLTCHLKDTYLGLRQVQVRTEAVLAEPLLWLELLETYRVTHSWAPNFGFKLVCDALSRAPARRFNLSRLVSLMNAGEQITPPVVEEFLRRTGPFGILPRVMQPAYGMAEVCTVMTYRNGFAPDTGVRRILKSSLGGHLLEVGEIGEIGGVGEVGEAGSAGEAAAAAAGDSAAIGFIDVGPPIPGVEIRIAGPDQQPLPELVIGRLQIRGEVVTPGYLHNAEANREAFVGEGWFDTGDLGFIAGGSLTITGREKEIIIIRGANFYCYEIEDVVNAIAGVEPTWAAACAVEDAQTGTESLAIFFVPRRAGLDPDLIAAVRAAVGREFGVVPACVLPLTRETFPKTTSGKIQRTQLKRRLAAGDFAGLLQQVDLATANDSTVPRWFFAPVWRPKRPAVRARRRPDGATLVLADGGGIADALVPLLGPPGLVVRAEAVAGAFARRSRQSYALDPRREADLGLLVAALTEDGVEVARVVHLWPCDHGGAGGYRGDRSQARQDDQAREDGQGGQDGQDRQDGDDGGLEAAQQLGSYSLLALAQALARAPRGDVPVPVRLLTASISIADGAGAEEPAPEHAPLLGLIKTLPLEWSWLECRHVHLPVAAPAANAERLAAELEVLDK
ncbi:MAG TPA: AMP-binding protein, partial [Thermoanaerobaculia bacterium]|nr:AMP-binding protein [Thermoanaerobaculia bacterium]